MFEMFKDEDKKSKTLCLLLGIAAGAFIVYLIMKSKQNLQQMNPPSDDINNMNMLNNWKPLDNIPNISSIPSISNILNIPSYDAANSVVTETGTQYKNNEKWVIKRGSNGRIEELNIIRDAKINDAK